MPDRRVYYEHHGFLCNGQSTSVLHDLTWGSPQPKRFLYWPAVLRLTSRRGTGRTPFRDFLAPPEPGKAPCCAASTVRRWLLHDRRAVSRPFPRRYHAAHELATCTASQVCKRTVGTGTHALEEPILIRRLTESGLGWTL